MAAVSDNVNYKDFFDALSGHLDERAKRLVASSLAKAIGNISLVSTASGLSRPTIYNGLQELSGGDQAAPGLPAGRQRRPGAGAKRVEERNPEIVPALDALIKPYVKGDPMSPLRWSCRSLRNLSTELNRQGFETSHVTVARLLGEMGYTLQSNSKSHEGGNAPDRDAQFEHINQVSELFFEDGQPVISVDAKKKELVGNFKNNGREYRPKGTPQEVEVYDFVNEQGRATPYGIYDIGANEGFVNVGSSSDTAEFAVDSIEKWWEKMGAGRYPEAHSLYINADGGGSNGSRNRLWKARLQAFADRHHITVHVSHFPPGTSKWNKMEHRMFSAISMNWKGQPLVSYEVIVNLIGATTNKSGLQILAEHSRTVYRTKIGVSDEEMATLNILGHDFHPEWNYVIRPRAT
ncbi:MAG: ISAzo13 family transposase [Kiritimatiellia bacterium]|jgi:hypothetical protein